MHDLARLREVGESAARSLATQKDWIHRRVETITFPFPDRPIYRRHISIDFTVPEGLKGVRDVVPDSSAGKLQPGYSACRFYVPVSLIRKWPPLPRLDLRDQFGHSIPFLTKRQNTYLDSVALLGLADFIVSSESPTDEVGLRLANPLRRQIALIASGTPAESSTALSDVLRSTVVPAEQGVSPLDLLRAHPIFPGLAQALCDNTLLWLRVLASPGDREVVKFSYDMPVPETARPWSWASFGLKPFLFAFDAPHCGATGSYHCNVVAPPPLEVVRGEIALYEPPPDGVMPDDPASCRRYQADSTVARSTQNGRVDLYTGVAESQAKFYVSGDRNGLRGRLFIGVLIQSQHLLLGALAASVVAAGVLALLAANLTLALHSVEATVALLLLIPLVLGSVLVRPAEHVLAGGFVIGLRTLVVASGVLPVLGAALTVVSGGHTSRWLSAGFAALALAETALAMATAVALYVGHHLRVALRPHPDASLLDDPRRGA